MELPTVIDRTGEGLELPLLAVLGGHCHTPALLGHSQSPVFRAACRLQFRGGRYHVPHWSPRPLYCDVFASDRPAQLAAIADLWAGFGVTRVEVWRVEAVGAKHASPVGKVQPLKGCLS